MKIPTGSWTPWAIYLLLKTLYKSYRLQVEGREHLDQAFEKPSILALWHGKMSVIIPFFSGRGLVSLVSQSEDGEMISRTLDHFGYDTSVRGSSSRGGVEALLKMVKRLEGGGSVIITPDGPRGPLRKVQGGVLHTAYRSACPVYPVSFRCESLWTVSSWDRFELPKPFSKVTLTVGEPLLFTEKPSGHLLELQGNLLEDSLNRLG